jgi:hypothetical protein
MNDLRDPAEARRREVRLRRVADGLGLAIQKSRARNPDCMDYGCYRVIKKDSREVVAGRFPYGYSLSLDAVEDVLDELEAERVDRTIEAEWQAAHPGGHAIDIRRGR